jgi:hypothetical protein
MKLWIAPLLITLMSTLQAQAEILTPEAAEICQLEQESQNGLYSVKILDLKKIDHLTPFYLNIANQHAIAQGYIPQALPFADLQALFVSGSEDYNDLYIKIRTYKSGNRHIEVMTWPGDNPYSTIFDSNGNVIGESSDGGYAYVAADGKITYCPQ